MSVTYVSTDTAPAASGAYSQATVANGFLYTAGFGPRDPYTRELIGETIGEQTRQTLSNIAAVLATHGLDFSDVVKSTVFLSDLRGDFAEFDAAYRDVVGDARPVRTTVGAELMNILVEIDVVAALRDTSEK